MSEIKLNEISIGEEDVTVKSHVDDAFADGEEEIIGILSNTPLPGSTPPAFHTKPSSSPASTDCKTERETTENTSENVSEEPEEPDIDEPDNFIDEPDLSMIEPECMIDEPVLETSFDELSGGVENAVSSENPDNEQAGDYSHIDEAQGPRFDGMDDTDDANNSEHTDVEPESPDTQDSEQHDKDTADTEDDIIDSVVYEQDATTFDGEQIKNDYKNQKTPLSVKTQQLIGFSVVLALFLLIFGITKMFNILSQTTNQQSDTVMSTEGQQYTEESWYNATESQTTANDNSTQVLNEFSFSTQAVPDSSTSASDTSAQTTENTTTESSTPSVNEVFGITDNRFQTINELTQYIQNAVSVINGKTTDTITQYQNGDLSQNDYTANLNLYYKAVVELAQLLVANKDVYINDNQTDIYNQLESQIRQLADVLETGLEISK